MLSDAIKYNSLPCYVCNHAIAQAVKRENLVSSKCVLFIPWMPAAQPLRSAFLSHSLWHPCWTVRSDTTHPIRDLAGVWWPASWLPPYRTGYRLSSLLNREKVPSPTSNSHRTGNLAPLGTLFFFPIWQLANSFRNYFKERKMHLMSQLTDKRASLWPPPHHVRHPGWNVLVNETHVI